jgi:hypothetical protein
MLKMTMVYIDSESVKGGYIWEHCWPFCVFKCPPILPPPPPKKKKVRKSNQQHPQYIYGMSCRVHHRAMHCLSPT